MFVRPRTSRVWLALAMGVLLAGASPRAVAQEPRAFGFEFEFAGQGNRVVRFEDMPWENYEKLMRVIVDHYGGNPATIKRVDLLKPTSNRTAYPDGMRPVFKAEWQDGQGRTWKIEPEYVASSGLDGYELVTPPLRDPAELGELLTRLKDSGLVREGLKSGVHLTLDARDLITPAGDAKALVNLILLHENMEPMLRRIFNPVRGGGHSNRFARSLAVDHEDLLRELDRLPPAQRTREKLEELFRARQGREAEIQGADPLDPNSFTKLWKYRAMNLAKTLRINELHDGGAGLVEFRMFDLSAQDPETHRLQAKLYQALLDRAKQLAESGERVRYRPRAQMPAGGDPSVYNTPDDPQQARTEAREFLAELGLDPAEFEPLLQKNLRPRVLPTNEELRGMIEALPTGKVLHRRKAFSYGFEFEGQGEHLVELVVPTDADDRARWGRMSSAEKRAYFRENVHSPGDVKYVFEPDVKTHKWLDPYWYVEGTGNWELHSKVMTDLLEATNAMREAKRLAGESGRGFHLHMRDNGPDWELLERRGSELADFIDRSSNWVWVKRVERLRTDLSLKSWSNSPMSMSDVDALSELSDTDRATVRVQFDRSDNYVDLEIRGFTRYVDDIELLARIYVQALKTGEFGPWRHTDAPLHNDFASWGGSAAEGLSYVEAAENYLRNVEGKELTPEARVVLEGIQEGYVARAGQKVNHYPTGVAVALQPWEHQEALPETLRRNLKFAREDFVRELIARAQRFQEGKYGFAPEVASVAQLTELGLSPETAAKVVEVRRGAPTVEWGLDGLLRAAALVELGIPTEKLVAAAEKIAYGERTLASALGLRGPAAAPVRKLTQIGTDLLSASGNQLVELLGLPQAKARALVAFGKAAAEKGTVDYAGLLRDHRLAVKKWVTESGLSDALLASLLPRPEASALVRAEREAAGETEGFGPRRAGSGAIPQEAIPTETVLRVLATVREPALARTEERLRAAGVGEAEIQQTLESLRGVKLELVPTRDLVAERSGDRIRLSQGLLDALAARSEALPPAERGLFRLRALGLILAHELAHVGGIRSEAIADTEGLKIVERSRLVSAAGVTVPLTKAELEGTVRLFERPLGQSHLDGMFGRLRELFRYGTTARRVENLERTARGEVDPLARYRRLDGTLEWQRVVRDRALREVGGVAHFALALFLKELAVVAKTGDRTRIEEFFDGLLSTDFYTHYGLFVVGARAGEVAYAKTLQRFVKPRFVNGILKTNLVLATGIALPQLVDGTFQGQAFAISVGSLGLSSAAVKAGVAGIKWVVDLRKAGEAGRLARAGTGLRRLARVGGWFYTAAELAVVLYLSEEIEGAVHGWLDQRAAHEALSRANAAFLAVTRDPAATKDQLEEAASKLHLAWVDYRNFLYQPLLQAEAELARRLEGAARKAQEAATTREEALRRLEAVPALKARVIASHGSVEAYAQHLVAQDEAELQRDLDARLAGYERLRQEGLEQVYRGQRRAGAFLADVPSRGWLAAGARPGAAGDPLGGRSDVFARFSRDRLQSNWLAALGAASGNRLQTYEDEAALLRLARAHASPAGATVIDELLGVVDRTARLDRDLADGKPLQLGAPAASTGLVGGLGGGGPR